MLPPVVGGGKFGPFSNLLPLIRLRESETAWAIALLIPYMAILLPPIAIHFGLCRFMVAGLAVGGSKG